MKRRTLVSAICVAVAMAMPATAQSVSETVLQGLADDVMKSGGTVRKGAVETTQNGVEWRDVTVSLAQVNARLNLPFVRAIERADGSVAITYPKTIRGFVSPGHGLPTLDLALSGKVIHRIAKPGRGQVHDVSTDAMQALLTSKNPTSAARIDVTEFVLSHTDDVGVPLQLKRIRDIPMSGKLAVDIKGGLGVLDRLVSLGQVSAQQSEVARTVIGIFAVKGSGGDDHLMFSAQVRENGAMLINGNPF